jgi:hypothetical protein
MKLPSYVECDQSPKLAVDEVGLVVKFHDAADALKIASDDACPIHGTYSIEGDDLKRLGKFPLGRIAVLLTHQDTGKVYARSLVSNTGTSDRGKYSEAELKKLVSAGGHFNVDLKECCCSTGEFGRFWVIFQLGRHVSPVLELEIFPPHCPELARKPVDLFSASAKPLPGGTGPEPATENNDDADLLFDEEFDGGDNATVMDHAETEDGFGEGEDSTAMDSLFDEEFDGGDNATVMDHAETEDGFGEDKNGD